MKGQNMRQTVVHIPSFEGRYKVPLVFSMIEGLKLGEGFKLICDQNPAELEACLTDAQIPNLKWTIRDKQGHWEVLLDKGVPEESSGCCGICGGHNAKTMGSKS